MLGSFLTAGPQLVKTVTVGADLARDRRLGRHGRRFGPGTVVAAAAKAIDAGTGKKLVGLDVVVLVG